MEISIIIFGTFGGIIVLSIILACYSSRRKVRRGIVVDAHGGNLVNGGQEEIATLSPPYIHSMPGFPVGQMSEQHLTAQPAGTPYAQAQVTNPQAPLNSEFHLQPDEHVPLYTPNQEPVQGPAHHVTENDGYTQLEPVLRPRGRVSSHKNRSDNIGLVPFVPEQSQNRDDTRHLPDNDFLTKTDNAARRSGDTNRRRASGESDIEFRMDEN